MIFPAKSATNFFVCSSLYKVSSEWYGEGKWVMKIARNFSLEINWQNRVRKKHIRGRGRRITRTHGTSTLLQLPLLLLHSLLHINPPHPSPSPGAAWKNSKGRGIVPRKIMCGSVFVCARECIYIYLWEIRVCVCVRACSCMRVHVRARVWMTAVQWRSWPLQRFREPIRCSSALILI